jgi:hypothetical protein
MEVIIINLETDFTENWIDMSYECLGIKYINGILLVIMSDCIPSLSWTSKQSYLLSTKIIWPLGKIVQPVISAAFTLNICWPSNLIRLTLQCSYYHTLHLKHRPVPSVFIKFMPALLLQKINRCAIHNENPEFQTSNHGNTCCYKYAIDLCSVPSSAIIHIQSLIMTNNIPLIYFIPRHS